ncbi:MAG: GAF domain-containing protein [Deltaproteobacteria bacterium]|nr:GAF domain-containing protein [Deltaproteobacteria bacterium]
MDKVKHIAIIGANREGLSLLPTLLQDKTFKVEMIVDNNKNALLFKLDELGYRFAEPLFIKVTSNIEDIKGIANLDIIINASEDLSLQSFLQQPEFRNVEKLSPLSAKLIWGMKEKKLQFKGQGADSHAVLLSSLREVVDAIRLTSDRKELLSLILRLAIESTNAEKGSLMLIDRDSKCLKVEIAEGMEEEIIQKIKVPLGEGIAGRVAQNGKPLLISGKASEDNFQNIRERSDVKSALCVPLIINGQVIGVINVNSRESIHAFTEEDLAFLTRLAVLAGEVILRSKEYEEMKWDTVKFTLWKEIDRILGASKPLEKRLNDVCAKLAQFIDGFACSIYVLNEDTQILHLKASVLMDTKTVGPFALHKGEGVDGWAANTGKIVILMEKDPNPDEPRKVYFSLPMTVEGRVVGLLSGQLVSPKGLLPYQESFLKEINVPIAEAIDNHQKQEKQFLKSNKMIAVDETGLELISITDPDKLPNIIATAAAAIIGADGSTFRIRYNGTTKYQLRAARGLDDEKIRASFLPAERDVLHEVMKAKKAVIKNFPKETNPLVVSLLSHPLKREGKVIGVLTLYNKIVPGTFYPEHFTKMDIEIVSRFMVYVEKAVLNLMLQEEEKTKMQDVLSDIMMEKEFLEKRAEEEIGRAKRFGKRFMIMIIHIPNLDVYSQGQEKGNKMIARTLNILKERIRNFDVVAKLDNERLAVMFLESDEGAIRLVGKLCTAAQEGRLFDKNLFNEDIGIRYGYAIFPDDGETFEALLKKASPMVEVKVAGNEDKWI